MFWHIIKHLFLLLLLLILEIAVRPNLPGIFCNLNPILVFLIFTAVVYQFYLAAVYGFVLGFILDLYSGLGFGIILLSLMLTLYFIYKIFECFLTNKSFYTLIILLLIATVIYNALIFGFSSAKILYQTKDMALLKEMSFIFFTNLFWQLILNLFFIIAIFTVFHLVSRRFKAVFVDTTR